jgi:hypothetical protein
VALRESTLFVLALTHCGRSTLTPPRPGVADGGSDRVCALQKESRHGLVDRGSRHCGFMDLPGPEGLWLSCRFQLGEPVVHRPRASDEDPDGEINVELELSGGGVIWPVQRAMKRCANGAEDGIAAYGAILGLNVGAPPPAPGRRRFFGR